MAYLKHRQTAMMEFFLQKYGKKLGSCEPINPNLDAFKFGGHTFCGRVDTKFLISHMTSLGHERKRSYG